MLDFTSEFARLGGKFESNRLSPDEQRLASFESLVGQSLPDDFRSFLQACGGAKIQSRCKSFRSHDIETEYFYGFMNQEDSPSIEEDFDELGLAPLAISFAQDAFGGQFIIILEPKFKGHVYFYDTEGPEDGIDDPDNDLDTNELSKYMNSANPPDKYFNFYFLAASFEEFIVGCQPTPA